VLRAWRPGAAGARLGGDEPGRAVRRRRGARRRAAPGREPGRHQPAPVRGRPRAAGGAHRRPAGRHRRRHAAEPASRCRSSALDRVELWELPR
jgi:hypothetical protein